MFGIELFLANLNVTFALLSHGCGSWLMVFNRKSFKWSFCFSDLFGNISSDFLKIELTFVSLLFGSFSFISLLASASLMNWGGFSLVVLFSEFISSLLTMFFLLCTPFNSTLSKKCFCLFFKASSNIFKTLGCLFSSKSSCMIRSCFGLATWRAGKKIGFGTGPSFPTFSDFVFIVCSASSRFLVKVGGNL